MFNYGDVILQNNKTYIFLALADRNSFTGVPILDLQDNDQSDTDISVMPSDLNGIKVEGCAFARLLFETVADLESCTMLGTLEGIYLSQIIEQMTSENVIIDRSGKKVFDSNNI